MEQVPEQAARRAIFRIPGTALLAVGVLAIGVTPAAFSLPGLQALFLLPIAAAVYITRVRTTAAPDGLTVRTLFGKRHLAWTELKGMSLTPKGRVRAVTTSGEEVRLPTVRVRHLPVLSLISDGLLPDPTGLTDDLVAPTSDAGPAEPGTTDPETTEPEATTEPPSSDTPADAEPKSKPAG